MPYADSGDTRLYYEEDGPADGRPVLLLHAALQTGESMDPLRQLLVPMGFRVVVPDQRGHGRTPNPGGGFSVPQLADDIRTLMDHLGLDRPLLAGFSLGGIVGMELARHGLLSGLVVLASRTRTAQQARQAFDPDNIRQRSPLWAQQLQTKHLEVPWAELATALAVLLSAWPGFSADDLAAIACPTLVVQGLRDLMVPAEQARELAGAVPGALLRLIPGAGHPDLLYRREAIDAVQQFMRNFAV